MKKIIAALAAFTVVIIASGCGNTIDEALYDNDIPQINETSAETTAETSETAEAETTSVTTVTEEITTVTEAEVDINDIDFDVYARKIADQVLFFYGQESDTAVLFDENNKLSPEQVMPSMLQVLVDSKFDIEEEEIIDLKDSPAADPLGKWDGYDRTAPKLWVYDADYIRTLAEEIFGVEPAEDSGFTYFYGDKLYRFTCADGGGWFDSYPLSVRTDGERYSVEIQTYSLGKKQNSWYALVSPFIDEKGKLQFRYYSVTYKNPMPDGEVIWMGADRAQEKVTTAADLS